MTSLAVPAPAPVAGDRPPRFLGVDALRGIAALAVCFCHFTIGSPTFLDARSPLRPVGFLFGGYGVRIFFVISGFVIALSLARAGYRLRSAPRYLLRRIARIDPPYLVSLLLALGMESVFELLPHYHGPPHLTWYQVLGHVGYLNGVLGWRWEISVYWSLAIEFQYYLCISLCFPLIFSRTKGVAPAAILVWSIVGIFLPSEAWVFRYGSLFATGFILCRYLEGRVGWRETLALGVVNAACVGWVFGAGTVVVSLLTAVGIYGWRNPGKPWLFFGQISYSLYLVHALIGFHLVNGLVKFGFAERSGPLAVTMVVALAFACTVPCAWLFWRWVEWPSHRLAQRLPVSGEERRRVEGKNLVDKRLPS